MAIKQLHELTEVTALLDADILHISQAAGNLDKKITKLNLLKEIQAEVDLNTSASGSIATIQQDIIDLQEDVSELRGLSPNNQTGTAYTLVLSDTDAGEVWMKNVAANVLTIPDNATVAFPIETTILIMMEDVGVTTILADTGVTLNGIVAGSGDLTQFDGVALKKRGTNTWVASPLTVV